VTFRSCLVTGTNRERDTEMIDRNYKLINGGKAEGSTSDDDGVVVVVEFQDERDKRIC